MGLPCRAGKAAKRKRCLSCVLFKMMKSYRQAHSGADPVLAVYLSYQSDEKKETYFYSFWGYGIPIKCSNNDFQLTGYQWGGCLFLWQALTTLTQSQACGQEKLMEVLNYGMSAFSYTSGCIQCLTWCLPETRHDTLLDD